MERGLILRREAGVLTDDELTLEQRQAGREATNLVLQMLRSSEIVDTPKPHYLPRIDAKRSNRVLLLDGGRGSGKTALLVTLFERWRDAHLEDDSTARTRRAESGLGVNPQGRIVPFGLLDLHPLPPSTNLLFHIIGRFERLVEWIDGDARSEKDPAAWLLTAQDERESRTRWRSLLTAVVAGWDSNVAARAARLDLEAYAVELEEAERQRLNLVDAFAAFIDALVKDFSRKRNLKDQEPPLFVLGIDDADMNPERSVELLETVRMLWHPRVAFLLTGCSQLFRTTLAAHCHRKLHGKHDATRQDATLKSLAIDIYDKVIPPGHRCELRPIPPANRLTAQPADLRFSLERILVEGVEQTVTLASYFDGELQHREALPDRLRMQIDLAAQVYRMPDSEGLMDGDGLASHAAHAIWRSALEHSALSPEVLADVVQVNSQTGALDVSLMGDPMGVSARTRTLSVCSDPETRHAIRILEVQRFTASLRREEPLPDAVTAALMLAVNVALDQDFSTLESTPSEPRYAEPWFVVSDPTFHESASIRGLSWPLPLGYTLPFYAGFSYRWKRILRTMGLPPKSFPRAVLHLLVQGFLHTTISVLWPKPSSKRANPASDWSSLAEDVVWLLEHGGTRTRRWALHQAGLLSAPEYGLPAPVANDWLRALGGELGLERRSVWIPALRSERREHLSQLNPQLATEYYLNRLDVESPNYLWREKIEHADERQLLPAISTEPEPTFPRGSKKAPKVGSKKASHKLPKPEPDDA